MWRTTICVFALLRVARQLSAIAQDTVPEILYEPPVPRREQPRQVFRHESCCPESHCCDVQKMVVTSQGAAEAELAKGVREAAALGGTQADHRRKNSENSLRRAEDDNQAAALILDANLEKDIRVAEADAAAMERELEEIRATDANLEQQQELFAEKAIGELEEEEKQAESDLRSLERENSKLAQQVAEEEAEAGMEETRAAVEQQGMEAAEIAAHDFVKASGDEEQRGRTDEQDRDVIERKRAQELKHMMDELHAADARTRDAINRAQNVLAQERGMETSTNLKPARVDITGEVPLDAHLREHEVEATAAEHEAEAAKADQTVALVQLRRITDFPSHRSHEVPAAGPASTRKTSVIGRHPPVPARKWLTARDKRSRQKATR